LARLPDGMALLVSAQGFQRLEPVTGRLSPCACPIDLDPGTCFNDGKVDRHGALWLGSSDVCEEEPLGRLWRIARDGVTEIAAGFVVSNGPAFAPDGRAVYFADTFAKRILRYALDGEGSVVASAVFAEVADGYPDGLTVDSAGRIWSSHWDGAGLTRYLPDGSVDTFVPVPARNVTSCAFGGARLSTLFVTTAATATDQPARTADTDGAIFLHDAELPGLIEPLFEAGDIL
jgi:sugar lactone lactonase YvrE